MKMPQTNDSVGLLMSEVSPERVAWLWPGYLPKGKLTVLDGDPGLGKSLVTLDIAARISTGHAMPDGTPAKPGRVVLACGEDGLADTIRPQLDAAGADTSKIIALPVEKFDNLGQLGILEAALSAEDRRSLSLIH